MTTASEDPIPDTGSITKRYGYTPLPLPLTQRVALWHLHLVVDWMEDVIAQQEGQTDALITHGQQLVDHLRRFIHELPRVANVNEKDKG